MENPKDDTWKNVSIALIVIIVVLVVLAVCFTVWYFHFRKKGTSRSKESHSKDDYVVSNPRAIGMKDLLCNKKAIEGVEWRNKMTAKVTLDSKTANCYLNVSEDHLEVSWTPNRQVLPQFPGRFDEYPCVLGEITNAPRGHYWEVQMGKKKYWEIGVAKESVQPQGQLVLSPENGFWVLSLWNGEKLKALTDPETYLDVTSIPKRLGVYLDYESKMVSFYDAEKSTHIYTFEKEVSGKVLAFFSPGNNDEEPLKIIPVRDSGGL
ncbi:TRI39 ligase, partial [Amia calva]|nr:TRI39 ligase [Amia calva]